MTKQGGKAQAAPGMRSRQITSNELWIAVARVYRSLSAKIEASFEDAGLNLTDFMLLEALLHRGAMTITEIQHAALLATGSMTVAVDRLESKGLVVRALSTEDRRVRLLQLTEQVTSLQMLTTTIWRTCSPVSLVSQSRAWHGSHPHAMLGLHDS